MARYFRVVNLEEYQHYKNRNPPWIKLHASVLDNYEFNSLRDASKLHLILIWLLASRTNNKMVWDETWIAQRIGASDTVDLIVLKEAGFIEFTDDASAETEGKAETEQKTHTPDDPDIQTAFDLWNELANETGLPRARALSKERKGHLGQRLHEHGGLDGWRNMLEMVQASDFLLGKKTEWKATFDFVLKRSNFLKIIEGNYENSKSTSSMLAAAQELMEEEE